MIPRQEIPRIAELLAVLQLASRSFGMIPASMALLRIISALLFLGVRLINLGWVQEFYSDAGAMPRRQLWLDGAHHSVAFSLFYAFGSTTAVFVLYLVGILAGVALLVGYRTRLATLICWAFAFSIYQRNPFINPASDSELQMCLFWGFFLPWGQWWSLDARKGPARWDPYLSWGTIAWRFQVIWMYVGAALVKTSAEWSNGTAVEIALYSDYWSRSYGHMLGDYLGLFDGLLGWLTEAVVWLEFFLPWLLLVPAWPVQLLGLLGLTVVHLGFGLCLNLESFSPVAIGLLVGFLPARAWPLRLRQSATESNTQDRSPWSEAFCTWALVMMIWSNLDSAKISPIGVNPRANEALKQLGLAQGWYMFVPPPSKGGWHVFRGLTAKGEWVNLVTGRRPEDLRIPNRMDESLPTTRHYLFYNGRNQPQSRLLEGQKATARYLRARWEGRRRNLEERLIRIEIYRFEREYLPGRKSFSPAVKKLIYSGLGN